MELKIYSPTKGDFVKEITWNHEEIKKEVAEKVGYYATVVYTDDQIKAAKTDRATLRKFVDALESKRKEIKKQCLAPYEDFEKKLKEITAIVNEPIQLIDSQVKAFEDKQKAEKMTKIEAYFIGRNPFEWLNLGQIFDDKWLNASVKLPAVTDEIDSIIERITSDLETLQNIPEFSFEATEEYKLSLDLNKAFAEGRRQAVIQQKKAEAEAARELAEGAVRRMAEKYGVDINAPLKCEPLEPEKSEVCFRCWLSVDDATALKNFFDSRNIEFEKM